MAAAPFRISTQTKRVLEALLHAPHEWHYGYPLSLATGLKSGTLYPILQRLEQHNWLETRWEQSAEGRPPRHMYRLTQAGWHGVREVLGEKRIERLEASWSAS